VVATISKKLKKQDVFIKDTIFAAKNYLNKNFSGIDAETTTLFFILRDPADCIVSNYKILNIALDDNLRDAWSWKDMLTLYDTLSELNPKTYLINGQDLLDNPEQSVKDFCEKAEVPFIQKSLSWKPLTENKALGDYCRFVPHWQDTIAGSSEIDKKHSHTTAKRDEQGFPTFEEISEEHRAKYLEYYKEQLPHYHKLCDYLAAQQKTLMALS